MYSVLTPETSSQLDGLGDELATALSERMKAGSPLSVGEQARQGLHHLPGGYRSLDLH